MGNWKNIPGRMASICENSEKSKKHGLFWGKKKKKNASKVRVYLVRERVVQEKSGEAGRNLIMQNYVSKCNRMSSKCFTCLKFAFRVDIGV